MIYIVWGETFLKILNSESLRDFIFPALLTLVVPFIGYVIRLLSERRKELGFRVDCTFYEDDRIYTGIIIKSFTVPFFYISNKFEAADIVDSPAREACFSGS